jgi:ATP-dependent exoDNAse (exonuclease V) beta subunit
MLLLAERFDLLTGQPRLGPTSKGHSPFAKYQKRIPEIHIHRACPAPAPTAGQPHQPRGSLKNLREALATIPPTPLPESIAPIAVDLSARRRLSVSEIRQADALLRGHDAAPLDRADEPEPCLNSDAANLPAANPPTGGDDARQLGDLVHLVLERIDRHSPGNADELVSTLAGQMPGTVSRDVLSMAAECVQTMLASPAFAAMASAERCDREIEFYLPWPLPDAAAPPAPASIAPRLIVGKLDCLLKSADGMRILDYKTGRIPPGRSPTQVLADYEMQLAIYALAARQLTGAWPMRSELVLLRDGAERVGFDPRNAPWKTLTPRINRAIAAILGQSVPDAAH